MRHSTVDAATTTMTIRAIGAGDAGEVERLAQRDSTPNPVPPLLGIEIGGSLVAVTSLTTGETIADPFRATAGFRAILELRAAQLRRADRRPRGLRVPLLRRPRASLAGSPPGAGGRLLTLRS